MGGDRRAAFVPKHDVQSGALLERFGQCLALFCAFAHRAVHVFRPAEHDLLDLVFRDEGEQFVHQLVVIPDVYKRQASVRLDVRRMEHLKNGTEMIGSHTRVKVVKNKVAPPFKEAEFDIMYGEGISRTSELVDLGVKYGIEMCIRDRHGDRRCGFRS